MAATLRKDEIRGTDYWRAFLYGLAVAFVIFIPFIIYDNGYFLFYGDFNVQQIPFYQMCHDAVRSGNVKWSWTTDLGANFVGSYSFYLLGSPFFWMTLPFPSEMVPHLMGPLLILKFGCASLTGFIYLKRYAKSADFAMIGGLLYAFSGFSVYNIFFNHFHEAIIIFPLLLWALDEFMYNRRRGIFCLMVFASCFVNYYFFVGQVAFCLLYWILRMACGSWRMNLRDFAVLFLESVLGVLLSAGLLLPTVLAVLQNPRVDSPPNGWNALLYNWNQRYIHIIECFFFPPDIPARPNFTPNSEAKWASLGAWLPLFSMAGVIAFLQRPKRHWLKKMLGLLFVMAMVPILNSAFQLFNSNYYARWFYMLTLMMAMATMISLQSADVDWKRGVRWTLIITLAIALPIGLMPTTSKNNNVETTTWGLEKYPTRFWSYVALALLSLLLLTLVLRHYGKSVRHLVRSALCGVCMISILYAAFFIALGKTQSEDPHKQVIPYALNGGADVHLPKGGFSRADFYNSMDNQAMFWQMPTIQTFHSIVPGSIMKFYPTVGVTRDVGSRPTTDPYGLRSLLSCRWLFDYAWDSDSFSTDKSQQNPKMPGWRYYDTQNGFHIWENQYYIPMGFSYDYYVSEKKYNETAESDRNLLLLKALVLTDSQIKDYGTSLLAPLPGSPNYSQEEYFSDCRKRKTMCCSKFSYDNDGFSATFTAEKPRLVFFSVPWESGWSARVNGQTAKIEQVSVGFMAVRVPAGTSQIRFTYETPGLKLGLLISGIALLVLFAYLIVIRKRDSFWNHEYGRKFYKLCQPLPTAEEFRARHPLPEPKQE